MKWRHVFYAGLFCFTGSFYLQLLSQEGAQVLRIEQKLKSTLSRLQSERREYYRLKSQWGESKTEIKKTIQSQEDEIKWLELRILSQEKKKISLDAKIQGYSESLKKKGLSEGRVARAIEKLKVRFDALKGGLGAGEKNWPQGNSEVEESSRSLHEEFEELWQELLEELKSTSRSVIKSGVVVKDERELPVNFLEVGKVQRFYRTKKGGQYALWVRSPEGKGAWQIIENRVWKQNLDQAYEVVRKQRTPVFLHLPMDLRLDGSK